MHCLILHKPIGKDYEKQPFSSYLLLFQNILLKFVIETFWNTKCVWGESEIDTAGWAA